MLTLIQHGRTSASGCTGCVCKTSASFRINYNISFEVHAHCLSVLGMTNRLNKDKSFHSPIAYGCHTVTA